MPHPLRTGQLMVNFDIPLDEIWGDPLRRRQWPSSSSSLATVSRPPSSTSITHSIGTIPVPGQRLLTEDQASSRNQAIPHTNERLHPESETVPPVNSTLSSESAVHPVAPNVVETCKYKRPSDHFIPNKRCYEFVDTIDEITTMFEYSQPLPDGWEPYTAPEGNIFFYNTHQNAYTHANLYAPAKASQVDMILQYVHSKMQNHPRPFPEDTAIVANIDSEHPETLGYYLVSEASRKVYWAEPVDQKIVTQNRYFALSPPQMASALQKEYCSLQFKHAVLTSHRTHVEIFPNRYNVTPGVLSELHERFTYLYTDLVLSEYTTCRWDKETINHIIKTIDRIKPGAECRSPHYMAVVARYMHHLYAIMFEDYHGELCARINRHESVFWETHENDSKRSRFFHVMSFFLFHQPSVYFKQLKHVWVDDTVLAVTWTRFIERMQKDWENSITPATVLLSANIGLLAIQSIDNEPGSRARSLAQIASYVSATLSLSIYLVVQILQRQHRQHPFEPPENPLRHLLSREEIVGLEWIAISVSLPIGLFIWSTITLLLALAFIFFHQTTSATYISLGAIFGVLAFFMFSLLYLDYLESGPEGDSLLLRFSRWLKSYSTTDAVLRFFSARKRRPGQTSLHDERSSTTAPSTRGRRWWRFCRRRSPTPADENV